MMFIGSFVILMATTIVYFLLYGKLKQMIGEAERKMEEELAFAKEIQTSSVPTVFPAFPEMKSFGLYALMDTAKAVGGDFYVFFLINDHTLALT